MSTTERIIENLKAIGFTDNEIKVYMALAALGEAKATEISKKTGLPRTTIISIMERLTSEGLSSTNIYHGRNYYWLETPELLKENLLKRAEIAGKISTQLSEVYRTSGEFPIANFYQNKKSIRSYIERFLFDLEKDSIIYTIDSPGKGNYQKILGDDYYQLLLSAKKKKNVLNNTLIPSGSEKLIDPEKLAVQNIEIRIMPKEIAFPASLWLANSTIVHFSATPPYLAAIKQQLIYSSQKSLFDYIWSVSTTFQKDIE
ncbi:MAG: helix-turn-helix domain-containing protein [Patescibacteria group bacterium]|jgi:sugar-specific transcriptional regulator TrmB